MAITVSGFYVQNMIDELDATNLGFDWTLTTHKFALLNSSATPNFDTDTSWSNTNEVTGTGWVTGGIALSAISASGTSMAPTLTISPAGTMMWDGNDIAVSGTTLSAVRAGRFYADALSTPTADALILLVDFDADFATQNGTLGVQWASGGIATVDWTP
jgi:hypothetical protein